MSGRLLFSIALLFVVFRPAFGQSSQLDTRICVVDLDTAVPLDGAAVEAAIQGSDPVSGVTLADGCVALSIALPVGVEENELPAEAFVAGIPYPNPVPGQAVIPVHAGRNTTLELEVFSIEGRGMVPSRSFPVQAGLNAVPVDLSELPAGLYMYRLSDDRVIQTGKLVNTGLGTGSSPVDIAAARSFGADKLFASRLSVDIKIEKDGYETVTTTMDIESGAEVQLSLRQIVIETNERPQIVAQNDLMMMEGDTLSLPLSATDADADPLLWSIILRRSVGGDVPSRFFNFVDNGDGTAQLDLRSIPGDAGTYAVEMYVSDGTVSVSDTFEVEVIVPSGDSSMVPINDLATASYKGFQGGLYPNGQNEPPAMHHTAGISFGNAVEPLDVNGMPNPNGKYILMSIGMSNTTQEFCSQNSFLPCDAWTFTGQAEADPEVNTSSLVIVNGSRGGRSAEDWVSPQDENYDRVKNDRIETLGLSEAQVQIIWVKVANPRPTISLPDLASDAFWLEEQLGDIARALKVRYPNVKQIFISSRIYAGYAEGVSKLNPEPYAYESAFSTKWAIEAQIEQEAGEGIDSRAGDLDYDSVTGWLGWGPYLWANGATPRSDGLIWLPEDFDDDFTHPGMEAERKVGAALLEFFKTSPYTQCWFVDGGVCQ